ncbi:hypothetical protein HDF11_002973 [Tunturiibacter psychrotolerans]
MYILDPSASKKGEQADILSTGLVASCYFYSLVKFLAHHLNRHSLLFIAIFGISIALLCLYRVAAQMLYRPTVDSIAPPEIQERFNFGLLGEPKEERHDASS